MIGVQLNRREGKSEKIVITYMHKSIEQYLQVCANKLGIGHRYKYVVK